MTLLRNMHRKIIILTSDDIRHNYFKIRFSNSPGIEVIKTYVESENEFELKFKKICDETLDDQLKLHFALRHNSEYDFFSDIIQICEDRSQTKFIKKNEINNESLVQEIIDLNPDLIVTYGCSIIKPPLIEAFKNRIINVHLGLSPYYFGSGTNFHALVNNEFYCVGYTFMYMNEGIDTGNIIHQSRAEILPFDNPHQIGNRLIKSMTTDFIKLVQNFDLVSEKVQHHTEYGKTYKRKDATLEKTMELYSVVCNENIEKYIKNSEIWEAKYPIIEQDFLRRPM